MDQISELQQALFHAQNQEEDLYSRYEALEVEAVQLKEQLEQALERGR